MADIYSEELHARFGLDLDLGDELPDNPWLRQILLRRTQRRYADKPVPNGLVRLLLAAAFSASSKSDFQQASVIWLKERGRRDRIAARRRETPEIPARCRSTACRGTGRRYFWCFSATGGGSSGSANGAAIRSR